MPPPTKPPDLRRIKALYEERARRLLGLARLRGVEPCDAEDIVQELFMKLWARCLDGEDIPNLAGYLTRIVVHECYRWGRQNQRKRRPGVTGPVGSAPDETERDPFDTVEDPHDVLAELVGRLDVVPALRQLPQQQLLVVVLHIYESRPLKEVAWIMNISESTAKTHWRRARTKLRQLGVHLREAS